MSTQAAGSHPKLCRQGCCREFQPRRHTARARQTDAKREKFDFFPLDHVMIGDLLQIAPHYRPRKSGNRTMCGHSIHGTGIRVHFLDRTIDLTIVAMSFGCKSHQATSASMSRPARAATAVSTSASVRASRSNARATTPSACRTTRAACLPPRRDSGETARHESAADLNCAASACGRRRGTEGTSGGEHPTIESIRRS